MRLFYSSNLNMLNIFKKKDPGFFSPDDQQLIVDAIKRAESETSGEIRLFVESRCGYVNALDRAKELFEKLHMYETEAKNGVLVYLAMKDRQLAVFGDEGIDQKVGAAFWQQEVQRIVKQFGQQSYALGIQDMVLAIGDALKAAFPYDKKSDLNELPDDIVYGK